MDDFNSPVAQLILLYPIYEFAIANISSLVVIIKQYFAYGKVLPIHMNCFWDLDDGDKITP